MQVAARSRINGSINLELYSLNLLGNTEILEFDRHSLIVEKKLSNPIYGCLSIII